MVGCDQREDITSEYKGSGDEIINKLATPDLRNARTIEADRNRKITILFSLPDSICMTNSLNGTAKVDGMYNGKRTTIKYEISLISHDGKLISKLFDDTINCMNSSTTLNLIVDEKQLSNIVDIEFPFIKCRVSVYDPQLDEFTTEEKLVNIVTPDIDIIRIRKIYSISSSIRFLVTIKNPLDKPLTNLSLKIDFTDSNPQLIPIGFSKIVFFIF